MKILCYPRPRTAVRISDEHMNTSITSWINHTISYVPGRYEYSCVRADPVWCSRARWRRGNNSRGDDFFSTVLVCTGFGKSRIPRDFTARERKATGNQTFPRELFGWERDIKISSGTVWMGSRERYLHGNGKKTISREILREFSRGNFPEEGPEKWVLVLVPSLFFLSQPIACHSRSIH